MTMVTATEAATQITVRTRMPGRFGLCSTWLKLLSPADPIVMPSGVMSWNDVWTIDTMGHRTTTAIRAIAGPIQSRGSRAASRRRQGDLAAPGRRAVKDTKRSAAAAGGLLDRAEDLRRAAGDGLPDLGLDHVLDGGPVRQRGVVDRVGDVAEEGGEHLVLLAHGGR